MSSSVDRRVHVSDRFRMLLGGAIGLIGGVLVWQFVATTQPVLLASPLESFEAVRRLAVSGELGSAAADSARTFGTGLLAAIVVGIPAGLLLARSAFIARSSLWLVFAVQAIPLVALAPLVSATVGFGFWPKVLIVFLSAVFPIVLNTIEGAKSVPQSLLDVGLIYRSRELVTWKDILIPYTVPYIMTGVRQAVATALIGTLVAEFFLSVSGVGALLLEASARFDIATVLGVTIVLALAAVALVSCGQLFERKVAPWRR